MKVLVFESSEDRAKLIRDLLKDYRYKIHIKSDGSNVLTEIKDKKPSLIIINTNIRPESGVKVLDKIKAHPLYAQIPTILISGFYSRELANQIKEYENVDYLVEPFKIKNFRHMVERWINFRSLYVS
jgi:DNA-binding response OmpR family regulator